ncbi:hypothetical protein ACFP3Q_09275 [Nocardioides sp. GCM10027113]|uniref:hypothetical protein n=1 Tax=unclassified Nocardioides TaxID=2615069 RepID=UPI00361C0F6B
MTDQTHDQTPPGDTGADGPRDLVALLERSMAGVHAPVDRLEAAARARGTTMRRRRRAGAALVSVAAVTTLGLGLPHVLGPESRTAQPPAAGQPTTEAEPSHPWWEMPEQQMRRQLSRLLPDHVRVDSTKQAEPGSRGGALVATVTNTAAGTGMVDVLLSPPAPPSAGISADGEPTVADRLSCPGNLGATDECSVLLDDEGAPYARLASQTVGEITILSAEVLAPDGGMVYVATANTLDDKWGEASTPWGPEPPVGMDDLLVVAESASWRQGR